MEQIVTRNLRCPYCGESIDILIDCSVSKQSYIEDCQVCCRPIEFDVSIDQEGTPFVLASHENE